MGAIANLGRSDRLLRIGLGLCLGVASILSGHQILGRLMGLAAALLILSAARGT
jgi:hypothetical protein